MGDEKVDQGQENPRLPQAAAIEKAKHELEHMIDMCPQVMVLVGANRRILRTNRALLSMLGKAGYAEVLGRSLDELFVSGDQDFFDRLLGSSSGIYEAEVAVDLPNRGAHPLRFSSIGAADADVRVILIQDVTSIKTHEEAQKQAHRKEAIQELIGALMHTINQHLTVITVRAKLMTMAIEKGETHPEEMKRGLADISELTLKIAETLRDVGQLRNFNTVSYVNGLTILDLDTNATPEGGPDLRNGTPGHS